MKNGEHIIDVLGKLDSEYIDEYIFFENKKKIIKHSWNWKSAIIIAACLTVIIGGFYSFSMLSHFHNINLNYSVITKSTETSTDSTLNTTADGKYISEGKVIDNFEGKASSACYMMPSVGKYFCFIEVNNAFKKFSNEDVTYFLAVDIFSSDKKLGNNSDAMNLELIRLQQLGYHIGYASYWTYEGAGQKINETYVAGYFTQDEIKNFTPSSTYGYAFSFMINGDGSPVDSSQGIITNFTESTRE